jgi:hypothetical protein
MIRAATVALATMLVAATAARADRLHHRRLRRHGHPGRHDLPPCQFRPERGEKAKCPAERILGGMAHARLKALIDQGKGSVQLTEVACTCVPGTHGTRLYNYGRVCGTLKIRNKEVGIWLDLDL